MKKLLFLITLILLTGAYQISAQVLQRGQTKEDIKKGIQNPEFPGGDGAFRQFIYDNIKVPESTLKSKVKGEIKVHFVIKTDGSVDQETVYIKKGLEEGIDKAVIEVVKKSPKWTPYYIYGEAVLTEMGRSIYFNFDK